MKSDNPKLKALYASWNGLHYNDVTAAAEAHQLKLDAYLAARGWEPAKGVPGQVDEGSGLWQKELGDRVMILDADTAGEVQASIDNDAEDNAFAEAGDPRRVERPFPK